MRSRAFLMVVVVTLTGALAQLPPSPLSGGPLSIALEMVAGSRDGELGQLPPLPTLNIDLDGISVAGLSSGADFAVQFAVAFSKTVRGLGVFAGQPFHCAVTRFPNDKLTPPNPSVPICEGCPVNRTLLYDHCKGHDPALVNVSMLAAAAQRLSEAGAIDDVKYLARNRFYTYCGTKDGTITATKKNRDFFAQFTAEENILSNFSIPSGHCWPQDTGANLCGLWNTKVSNPWPLENCGYDGPGAMLEHVYGALNPPAQQPVLNSIVGFDQSVFNGNNTEQVGLSKDAVMYIPNSCATGAKCKLVLLFHGCAPTPWHVAPYHSLSRWAETNDMVILYPHSSRHGGANATREQKIACWDGYGQTGPDYDTKNGVQMKAIMSMIQTISGTANGA